MKLAVVWVALALSFGTGCLWANRDSDSMWGYSSRAMLAGGHVQGGVIDTQVGGAGLYIGAEANLRDVSRPQDDRPSSALGGAIDLRASLFGILGPTHELERYFDLGGEAGAGAALILNAPKTQNPLGVGAAYAGVWIELGTFSLANGYVAIVSDIRRETFGSGWADQTEVTIGLAWRHRELLGPMRFHD